jgi:hypothetical protein
VLNARTLHTLLLSLIFALAAVVALPGCAKPNMPSVTGAGGIFHDIAQVRKGMSPNEVRRVMGQEGETVYEEGLRGIDGGNYVWSYPEGKVYFNTEGVTHVHVN